MDKWLYQRTESLSSQWALDGLQLTCLEETRATDSGHLARHWQLTVKDHARSMAMSVNKTTEFVSWSSVTVSLASCYRVPIQISWVLSAFSFAFKGFKTPQKTPKSCCRWLGIYQPKWQNYKIVISPAGNIGSIPNFDTIIEPHSWHRGWSWITKLIFKMADGRHIAEYWKSYNLPINGPIWMKLGWSHHIMSPICPPCCDFHGNGRGALYIQQLWASGGRTRDRVQRRSSSRTLVVVRFYRSSQNRRLS